MRLKLSILIFSAVALCGCGGVPDFADVSPKLTANNIAQKVRCELRGAAQNIINEQLRTRYDTDPRVIELLARYQNKDIPISDFIPNPLAGTRPGKLIDSFGESSIAYLFTLFAGTQTANKAGATFMPVIADALFTFGGEAGADLTRSREQKFLISETFVQLAARSVGDECMKLATELSGVVLFQTGSNLHPISGRIGLERVLRDFYELSIKQRLADPSNKGEAPFVANEIIFKTITLATASANLTALPNLVGSNVTSENSRTDQHQLNLSFVYPTKDFQFTAAQVATNQDQLNRLSLRSAGVVVGTGGALLRP